MIDTHAHLGDAAFGGDLDAVVERARRSGVKACIVVGELPAESPRIREIERRYPGWAFGGLGLFPSSFGAADVSEFERLSRERWTCFGEIGLDTWLVKDEALRRWHEEVFMSIVAAAKARDLPVNVHSRSCTRRVVELLAASGHQRVHLHACEAKASTVRRGIEAGFYFSITANVAQSEQKRKLARLVPLEQMLLETDAPALGPVRGSRNEPSNLSLAVAEIAQIKGIDPEEVERVTDENAVRLYRLPLA